MYLALISTSKVSKETNRSAYIALYKVFWQNIQNNSLTPPSLLPFSLPPSLPPFLPLFFLLSFLVDVYFVPRTVLGTIT